MTVAGPLAGSGAQRQIVLSMDFLWVFIPLAAAAAFLLYYYVGGARQRMLSEFADQHDPSRRWAHGVFGLISGAGDHAYEPSRALRRALGNWWDINTTDEFRARFAKLCAEQPSSKPEAAWCWVRAVNLARMAAGAGLVSHEVCWQLIGQFLPRIQRVFSGWEDLGQNYLTASEVWLQERNIDRRSVEDVADNINVLREGLWREVSFSEPLGRKLVPPPRPSRARELLHMLGLAIDWAIEFRMPLIILAFAMAVVIVLAQSFLSTAAAKRDLIGTWAGELVEDGSLDAKTYSTRRWQIVVRPDQTGTQIMRWYLGRQRQEEAVEEFEWTLDFEWSVKDLVWRLTCTTISPGYACEKKAYRISMENGAMRYSNISGRVAHTMRKVPTDYALP
jgi:hypothetical protein